MSEGNETNLSGERNYFIILTIVMIGVVLVVALARPFIFEYVVPILMGEGQPSSAVQEEQVTPDEVVPPANEAPESTTEEIEEVEESQPAEEESAITEEDSQTIEESTPEINVIEENPESIEGETQTVSEEETQTSEETVTETEGTPETSLSITHVVKTGETLTTIAEQYKVSIDAIVTLNALSNANRIKIGDTLKIPPSESD